MPRNPIFFASQTGNTEKVAHRIRQAFDRYGWTTDLVRLSADLSRGDRVLDFRSYDFLCFGSNTYFYAPAPGFLEAIGHVSHSGKYGKVVPGPKLGLAFATLGGAHLGPREADANLATLEILFEHLGFASAGSIAVPGRYPPGPKPDWFYPDLYQRPNGEDLASVDDYVATIIESDSFAKVYGKQKRSSS